MDLGFGFWDLDAFAIGYGYWTWSGWKWRHSSGEQEDLGPGMLGLGGGGRGQVTKTRGTPAVGRPVTKSASLTDCLTTKNMYRHYGRYLTHRVIQSCFSPPIPVILINPPLL